MTQDLFGAVPSAVASKPRAAPRDATWKPAPPPQDKSNASPYRPAYYQCRTRTLSHDEVLKHAGFHEAAAKYPDHEVIVVLDTTGDRAFTYLEIMPRNHPSRLGADGRPDPAKAPFWRHGEIIHIAPAPVAKGRSHG